MDKKIKNILASELVKISPSSEELKNLEKLTSEIIKEINSNIRKLGVRAKVFVGGSFAKKTIIRKKKYDIDLFVRFNKKYKEEELFKLLTKIVPKKSQRLHGSRDYFRLRISDSLEFEIIPVVDISKPGEARNITDLSYFHVKYIAKAIAKNKKLAGEIKLVKAFTHYQDCYGAESYIRGFSGYSLEILVAYYGSFEKFLKAIAKLERAKRIYLDPAKHYKNQQDIIARMNESKLYSPIVLVDPTFKDRNALAGLSNECLEKFKLACAGFLKSPSVDFFISRDKELEFVKKYRDNTVKMEIKSEKQAGDIAGTKIRKFYEYFIKQCTRYFEIISSDFVYDESKNIGKILLALNRKEKVEFRGPPVNMKQQLELFKTEHAKIIVKSGMAWAYENNFPSFSEFLSFFKTKNSKIIESMGISFL
jgi:tRNA nucleotidyltransferase (CCA-adding enzyme)